MKFAHLQKIRQLIRIAKLSSFLAHFYIDLIFQQQIKKLHRNVLPERKYPELSLSNVVLNSSGKHVKHVEGAQKADVYVKTRLLHVR